MEFSMTDPHLPNAFFFVLQAQSRTSDERYVKHAVKCEECADAYIAALPSRCKDLTPHPDFDFTLFTDRYGDVIEIDLRNGLPIRNGNVA
jgi:hypothetical protein